MTTRPDIPSLEALASAYGDDPWYLAVHGFATPGVVVGMNGVIALAGGASLPVGAGLLALTALPGLRRPRRIATLLVLQGTLGMGTGEKFDPASGHELPTGSYSVMPKGVRHFVWAKGETVFQVSGMGPFEITYVNPADDPRNAKK